MSTLMPKIKVKRFKQESAPSNRTHTHTHGRYQAYYLSCYAVDKNRKRIVTKSKQFFLPYRQTDRQTDGHTDDQ